MDSLPSWRPSPLVSLCGLFKRTILRPRVAVLYAAGDLFACRHCYGLKQFPAYLNRWDSQQARNEGVFAH